MGVTAAWSYTLIDLPSAGLATKTHVIEKSNLIQNNKKSLRQVNQGCIKTIIPIVMYSMFIKYIELNFIQ